ncbi:MAG: MarR family transcriptional regulator [Firmicutes bacterium]|nr:MarR family transcriptional regulator [Bacillota bacterium]
MSSRSQRLNDLITRIANKLVFLEGKVLKDTDFSDLTLGELHVIEAIGTECPRSMSEIAGTLEITLGALTPTVDRLVNKGYVSRRHCEDDRRLVLAELTPRGKAVCEEYAVKEAQAIDQIIGSLTAEELNILEALLEKLFNQVTRLM